MLQVSKKKSFFFALSTCVRVFLHPFSGGFLLDLSRGTICTDTGSLGGRHDIHLGLGLPCDALPCLAPMTPTSGWAGSPPFLPSRCPGAALPSGVHGARLCPDRGDPPVLLRLHQSSVCTHFCARFLSARSKSPDGTKSIIMCVKVHAVWF